MDLDGIDAEVMFPNKGLAMWATPDAHFAMAQCRVYNDWAWEQFRRATTTACRRPRPSPPPISKAPSPRCSASPSSASGADAAVQAGVGRARRRASRTTTCPYFDPLWAAIQDAGLPITFHVSTGRDPRAARGNGGAVINYVSHSLSPTIEPVANLCASGVLERFPELRFATIEAGIGWVPWLLDGDGRGLPEAPLLGAAQAQASCRASTSASTASPRSRRTRPGWPRRALRTSTDNFMWGNDYPHHEGTWPHSAEAIERTMGQLSDAARAKILGLNAARLFGFEVKG